MCERILDTKLFPIRQANQNDLKALPALEARADKIFEEAGMVGLPEGTDEQLLSEAKIILVAGKPPAGFARIEEVDNQAHLEQLSVSPEVGNNGIGGSLLEAACDWAAEKGYESISLSTFRDIPWNAPFYGRHGFVVLDNLTPELIALREHEIELGLDKFGSRVVMKRSLVGDNI